jgi:hypothetical protein
MTHLFRVQQAYLQDRAPECSDTVDNVFSEVVHVASHPLCHTPPPAISVNYTVSQFHPSLKLRVSHAACIRICTSVQQAFLQDRAPEATQLDNAFKAVARCMLGIASVSSHRSTSNISQQPVSVTSQQVWLATLHVLPHLYVRVRQAYPQDRAPNAATLNIQRLQSRRGCMLGIASA